MDCVHARPTRAHVHATLALLFAANLIVAGVAQAGVKIWDGSSSALWSVAANWSGNVAPVNGDDLVFPGTTRTTVTNDLASLRLNSIVFTSGTNYVVRGNSITVSNNISGAQPSPRINTIELAITCAKSQIFECDTAGATLVFNGNIDLGANTVTDSGVGNVTYGGIISGTGGITKSGSGTMRMQGTSASTYSGTTAVNVGTLELAKSGTAIAGPLTIGDGTGSDVVRLFANQNIGASVAVTINSSGLLDLNGNTDTIGALTITQGDVTTGAGTLTLGGDLTSGAFVGAGNGSIAGRLSLGSATRTINVANSTLSSAELIISASISGNAGVGLIKAGTGTLLLGGSNTYSGLTTISTGLVVVTNKNAFGSSASGTLLSGGNLELDGITIDNEPLTNSTSSSGITAIGSATSWWTSNVVLNADTTISVLTNGYLFLSGVISGPGALTKNQPGTLSFYGGASNTYTNTTTVNEGALELNRSASDGSVLGPLVIGDGVGGPNADVVRIFLGHQLANSCRVTVNSSGLLDLFGADDFGSLTGSGNVMLETSPATLVPGNDNSSTTFNGIISGAGGVIKRGSGAMTLNGNNTYTGSTEIDNGVLTVNGLQPQSALLLYGGTLNGTGTVGEISSQQGGTISPGNSPGRITCSNVFFAVAHPVALVFELNGTTAGSSYDQITARGTISLGDSASLQATLGFASAVSNTFTIIDNDGADAVTGALVGLPEGATFNISGIPFKISYAGGTGNDVVLTQILPLPSLSSFRSGTTNVVFTWPTNYTGFTLESRTNLVNGSWAAVAPPPVVSGLVYAVTNATTDPQRFYRLRAP